MVIQGFPGKKYMLPKAIQRYWIISNELSEFKGFVIVNQKRIFIPQTERERILKDLHSAHQGIVRMKRRARSTVYWPGIDEDIWNFAQNCEACQKRLLSQTQEEMEERESNLTARFKWLPRTSSHMVEESIWLT